MKKIRMGDFGVFALVCVALVAILAPQQIPVLLYKGAQFGLAAFGGYKLDCSLFPYARPHEHFLPGQHSIGVMCMLRRAIVVGCALLAVGIAL